MHRLLACGLSAAAFISTYLLIEYRRRSKLRRAIQTFIRQRDADLRQWCSYLREVDDDEVEDKQILELNIDILLEKLRQDQLKPTRVLRAYLRAAIRAHSKTNCLCVIVPDCYERAKELENRYTNSSRKPPLYGLPVSMKESIPVQGCVTSLGYARSVLNPIPASQDAHNVATLKQLGAVPFATTNVPQSLISFGCSNPVYGATINPHNVDLSPGGSSGGEGALIAAGGSMVGFGSDIGGSVRIPSHFCGIVGLKPTSTRLSVLKAEGSLPGRAGIYSTTGPMGRDVRSVATVMKAMLDHEDFFGGDPFVTPLPFNSAVFQDRSHLRIGYYSYNGVMEVTPAVERALLIAKETLEDRGHTLVEIDMNHMCAVGLFAGTCFLDGGAVLKERWSIDLVDPHVSHIHRMHHVPAFLYQLIGFIIRPFDPVTSAFMLGVRRTPIGLRDLFAECLQFKRQTAELWQRADIDVLISPPQACSAIPNAATQYSTATGYYTAAYNLLDYVAGVVPCTETNEKDIVQLRETYPSTTRAHRIVKNTTSVGMPVGVQVITPPHREELCLRVMLELEDAWKQ